MIMQLIKEVDFRPLDKLVITFEKFRTHLEDQRVVDKDKSSEEEQKTEVVKTKVKYNQQVAKILAVPVAEVDLTIGDEILVDLRACFPLDGYKDIYIIPKYNVIGVMWPEDLKE